MTLPTKRFRTVLTNVTNTLAGLASFQTVTDSADSTEAATHIYDFAARDDGTQDPPRIILDINSYQGRLRGGRFVGPCEVLALLEYRVPAEHTDESSQAGWFWAQVENWFDELEAACNGGGGLSLENVMMSMPPGLVEEDDNNGQVIWITQFMLEVQT